MMVIMALVVLVMMEIQMIITTMIVMGIMNRFKSEILIIIN